jgi:hypothetical protein
LLDAVARVKHYRIGWVMSFFRTCSPTQAIAVNSKKIDRGSGTGDVFSKTALLAVFSLPAPV